LYRVRYTWTQVGVEIFPYRRRLWASPDELPLDAFSAALASRVIPMRKALLQNLTHTTGTTTSHHTTADSISIPLTWQLRSILRFWETGTWSNPSGLAGLRDHDQSCTPLQDE
jgi:hypothetical protein